MKFCNMALSSSPYCRSPPGMPGSVSGVPHPGLVVEPFPRRKRLGNNGRKGHPAIRAVLCVSSAKWPTGKVMAMSTLVRAFPIHCALVQGERQLRIRLREVMNLLKVTSPILPTCSL